MRFFVFFLLLTFFAVAKVRSETPAEKLGNALDLYNADLYAESLEYSLKLVDEFSDGKSSEENLAKAIYMTGINQFELADFAKAEENLTEALRMYERLNNPDPYDYALALDAVSDYWLKFYDFEKSEKYLSKAVNIASEKLRDQPSRQSYFVSSQAEYYSLLGEYETAMQYADKSLQMKLLDENSNKDGIVVAHSLIADLYMDMNDAESAEKALTRALDIASSEEISPRTLISLYTRKSRYCTFVADFECAEKYFTMINDIVDKIFPENHPRRAVGYSNFGRLKSDLGDYEAAEELFLKSLEINRNYFGENGPQLISDYGNLGNTARSLGNMQKSEEYKIKSLELARKAFKTDHPQTAVCLNNLAMHYDEVGDYEKAEEYILESVRIKKKFFGEDNPNYAFSLINAAGIYKSKNQYVKAEELLDEAGKIFEKNSGKNDLNYAYYLESLASLQSLKREYPQALTNSLKALQIKTEAFGTGPQLVSNYSQVGSCYLDAGNYSKAAEMFEKADRTVVENYGEHFNGRIYSLRDLSQLKKMTNDYESARDLLDESREILFKYHDENSLAAAAYYKSVAYLCEYFKKYDESLEFYSKTLDVFARLYGEDSQQTAKIKKDMADVYINTGDFPKAKKLLDDALTAYLKAFGPDYPQTASCYYSFGNYYGSVGNAVKSEEYLNKALEIYKSYYGDNSAEIPTIYNMLGLAASDRGDSPEAVNYFKSAVDYGRNSDAFPKNSLSVYYTNLAVEYYETDNHESAIEALNNSIGLLEDETGEKRSLVSNYVLMSKIYSDIGDVKKAEQSLKKASDEIQNLDESDPKLEAELEYARGKLNLETQDYPGAAEFFANAAELFSDEQAFKTKSEKDAARSTMYSSIYLEALCDFKMQKYAAAAAKLQRLTEEVSDRSDLDLTDKSNLSSYWHLLGLSRYSMASYEGAETAFRKSIEIMNSFKEEKDSDYSYTLEYLAKTYSRMNKYILAEETLNELLEIQEKYLPKDDPKKSGAYFSLGELYMENEEFEKAAKNFEKSIALLAGANPKDESIAGNFYYLGHCLTSLGNYEKAKEAFEKGLEILDVNNSENENLYEMILKYLISVCKRIGDEAGAEKYDKELQKRSLKKI